MASWKNSRPWHKPAWIAFGPETKARCNTIGSSTPTKQRVSYSKKYTDSSTFLEHVTNLGDTLGQLLAVSDMSVEIYGTPSEELVTATEGLDITVYTYFQEK